MSLQPAEVYRGQAAELLKETLINLSKKFNSLLTISSTGIDELKEYYVSLRNEIHLATRESIQQLNEHNDEFIREINRCEKDTTESFESNDKTKKEDLDKIVQELSTFHLEWTRYLDQPKLDDDQMTRAYHEAVRLSERIEQERLT